MTQKNSIGNLARASIFDRLEDGSANAGKSTTVNRLTCPRWCVYAKRNTSSVCTCATLNLRANPYPMFLTALRTGLRLGELIALHWQDCYFGENDDDPNRFFLVRRNYNRGEFTTTKNHRVRRVDMSREVKQALLDVRDQMALKAFERGEEFVPELVFPSAEGKPLDGISVYRRQFLPCLEASGLRRITFHQLRHSFASHLIQAGASLAYVKEQMGHSSVQVTVDVYGHLEQNLGWADKLDTPSNRQPAATQAQPEAIEARADSAQRLENIGGPARI
jgi:integrase